MARLVMKFGGTSVADIDRIRNVAQHVKREVDAGHEVAVVVSAMSGKTNELVGWCRAASPLHDAREYDAVVASGEQVTAGLLAITLEGIGINARSWQGWQLPILTSNAHGSARILEINGAELIKRFKERKQVAVISGFQGIHKDTGRITTLGRGGSDTSAVAIGSCQPCQERALMPMPSSVSASSPAVTCSPEATTASYSRASWSGAAARHQPTSSLVLPVIADTTTATSWPASTSRLTCCATFRMRSISATEVPPNFITRRAIGARSP